MSTPSTEPDEGTRSCPPGAARALAENVRAGLEVAFFRPVDRDRFRVSLDQIVLLSLTNLGLGLAWGYLLTDAPRGLYATALSVHASWLLAVFFLAWLASREASSEPGHVARTVVILLSPISVGWIGYAMLDIGYNHSEAFREWILDHDIYYGQVFALWIAAIYGHAIRVATRMPKARAVAMALVFGVATLMVLNRLPSAFFWFEDSAQDTASDTTTNVEPLDVEVILHEQRARVEAAVANLAPERPGIVDLYFIGFAADARQDVFRREVETIRGVMDRRFETAGRSLVLMNHHDTVQEHPLASGSNLADALRAMAGRLNPNEDVLVLYLTGHGSKSHDLRVRFPRFPLNSMNPAGLHGMIADAGIEWPAIIISACYSGGYVEALRDEQSLVATSAAADRTSFGCGNDSDMTYFGRAYFEEQLGETHDFAAAFEAARTSIEEKETAEGLTPSQPQIALGEKMARRLERVRDRLRREESLVATHP